VNEEEKQEVSKVELPEGTVPTLGDQVPTTAAPGDAAPIEDWETGRIRKAQENGRKLINEEDGIQDEWYKEAMKQSLQMLPEFLRHLSEDYQHDYGTICHALVAGAIATVHALNETDQGGITGFQTGAIMWEFIQHWMHKEGPMRLLEYGDMLYPQYVDKFDRVLTQNTFKWLQEEANKKLSGGDEFCHELSPDVRSHMEDIVAGKIPFGYRIKEED